MNNNIRVLRIRLEELYEKYRKKHSSIDPVWILHEFQDPEDIEIAALVVSSYSYGRVEQINSLMEKLFGRIGLNLREFTLNFSEQKDKKLFEGTAYRFNSPEDMLCLFLNIKNVLLKYGSLKDLFLSGLKQSDTDVRSALRQFAKQLKSIRNRGQAYDFLIPSGENNSACKRMNLFLRWMVREDEIDLGCWKEAGKEKLIIPLDTHVHRNSLLLGLMSRRSADMTFAVELTNVLKEFDPSDPVKYDFALCHIGIDSAR